jgi:hypothetical protein
MAGIEPGVLYIVTQGSGPDTFGFTPDGVGMIWHDSEEEAIANSLDLDESSPSVELTEQELDDLRNGIERCSGCGNDLAESDPRYGCRYCPPERDDR